MKLTKKRITIISAIVLVLLGGLAAFWVWQAQGGRFFVAPGSSGKKKDVPQYAEDKQQDLIDEVNKKQGTGDYEGAIALLEGQQNAGDAKTQLLLAGAYATAGKTKEALEIYKKLDDAGTLPDAELENMAATAERAGDYQLAIDTYKRAKEYAASSNEHSDDQSATYDYQIAELEKKL